MYTIDKFYTIYTLCRPIYCAQLWRQQAPGRGIEGNYCTASCAHSAKNLKRISAKKVERISAKNVERISAKNVNRISAKILKGSMLKK